MGANPRSKGQRAEREVVKLLHEKRDELVNDILDGKKGELLEEPFKSNVVEQLEQIFFERNQQQTNRGGFDLIGVEWLAIEIKHQENFSIGSWWSQTLRQSTSVAQPVLIYRRNRIPFRVRMFAKIPLSWDCAESSACVVDISIDDFLSWFKESLWFRTCENVQRR